MNICLYAHSIESLRCYVKCFRKAKKVTRKPTKAAAASEATTPELEGLSYVSTGPGQGSGSGVYFVDFSDEYKSCLKRTREEIEKETHLSMLEKREAKWADEISKDRNLPIEDRLLQLKVCFCVGGLLFHCSATLLKYNVVGRLSNML